VALVAVGAAGGGAALAVASVPDGGTGEIHACYELGKGSTLPATSAGNVRIIDPSAGQTCSTAPPPAGGPASEGTVDWNVRGPQGPPGTPGAPGAPGKSVTIASGHTFTISGGQVITVGGGNGITLAPPRVNERGPGIGQMSIGGSSPLSFDVFAVSFAAGTSAGGSSGKGAGRASLGEISITKVLDKASTKLFQACASGKHYPKATITLRKAGKPYLSYQLTDVLITSYQLGGAGSGGSAPLESISISFGKIKLQYHNQK
jgi:type VI secretion system secreted protein Hcp